MIRLRGGVGAVAAATAMAVGLAACSNTPSTESSTTSTSESTTSTTGAASTSSSTTSEAAPAVAQVEITAAGVVITLRSHVTNLASAVTNAKLTSSTTFSATLTGVASPPVSSVHETAQSGLVGSVSLTVSGSNVEVSITLLRPVTNFATAVGGGQTVQITFS